MGKRVEKIVLFFADFLAINGVWVAYYWLRVDSGWFRYPIRPEFWLPMFAVYLYWMIVFLFFGLYRSWYAKSRFDEFTTVFKAVTFGVLFLFFAIFIDDVTTGSQSQARLLIALYWALLIVALGGGRIVVRSFQRHLLLKGIGLRNTVIVGWSKKAREVFDLLEQFPALGHKVIGFVKTDARKSDGNYKGVPTVGSIDALDNIIEAHKVKEVVIALDSAEHRKLLDILGSSAARNVSFKIIPDLYDIVSGQARTDQLYGVPLIEIMPELMKPWEQSVKRAIDVIVSLVILIVGLPIWILVGIAIAIDSPGGVFYRQSRVGKDGKIFSIIKFRSMYKGAEESVGPQWAQKNDPRITRVGRIIRKLHIDEVPNFLNVLAGDMSLVGPRPERPHFVEQLSREIPIYRRRLKVRPGITGMAQVKYKYDESIEDVRRKLQYDFFYIENMSLRTDFKILFRTLFTVFLGKGH